MKFVSFVPASLCLLSSLGYAPHRRYRSTQEARASTQRTSNSLPSSLLTMQFNMLACVLFFLVGSLSIDAAETQLRGSPTRDDRDLQSGGSIGGGGYVSYFPSFLPFLVFLSRAAIVSLFLELLSRGVLLLSPVRLAHLATCPFFPFRQETQSTPTEPL